MKNKSVQNCRFVHHAKFHCIMTTLNRLFKTEIQRGGGELEKSRIFRAVILLEFYSRLNGGRNLLETSYGIILVRLLEYHMVRNDRAEQDP